MAPLAIKVEKLSKAYQLGDFGTGTISRDLERYWARLQGKEDPFLKIGEENDRTQKGIGDVVWSLKDIDLEIGQGETIGIIGRNGAGKSTLLKVLSRVTSPTTGSVKVKGRVASLLEVGTGFHPELSGRENIFLNGAILGMRKAEIKRKFDEIVDFAGVERYIDTPVKRYSSGMHVRLAFAVAAHLESEILIVDEVLAVGDAEFQRKCLGKMGEVSKGEGRTVLFVSHNLSSIKKLCQKGLLLANGVNVYNGPINIAIGKYLEEKSNVVYAKFDLKYSGPAEITRVSLMDSHGAAASEIIIHEPWQIQIEFTVHTRIKAMITALGVSDLYGFAVKSTWQQKIDAQPGRYVATFTEDQTNLAIGKYYLHVSIANGDENIQFLENVISLTIVEGPQILSSTLRNLDASTGVVADQMKFNTLRVE